MPGEISFVLHGSLFEHEFYFVLETNRKQTTCTNKFSMCFVETTVCFSRSCCDVFFGVKRHATRDACAVAHFSSQGSKRAKLGSNKSQSKGQETSSDFVVSFGSLEQKLELERRTVCLSGRFFSCVVGFFALAADPRVFALRRVGNLGLWIFTW